MVKGNIFIFKVCAPFENLLYTYSKKSELSRVLWSKYVLLSRVLFSSYRTIIKGKSKKIYLFFTETSSMKQFRSDCWLLFIVNGKMNKMKDNLILRYLSFLNMCSYLCNFYSYGGKFLIFMKIAKS